MIVLRPMEERDVSGVMAIEEVVCEFPWTASIFSDCIKVGYNCWVLDETETNTIVGYGLLSMSVDEAHILNLCVKPSHQRQGLGLKMMRCLLQQAQLLHAKTVVLEVRVSNHGAFDLYQKLGFKVIGERKDYYQTKEGREDARVLSLTFESHF